MAPFEQQIERAIYALVAEPAFSAFAEADAGILVWNAAGERIVWASRAAGPLRQALTDGEDGEAVLPVTDAVRIKALAEGAAPTHGVQLERLRLNPERHSAPLTCACRLISVPPLGTLLVTAIAGPVPLAETAPAAVKAKSPPSQTTAPVERLRRGETVRFVWRADEHCCITTLSPAFAEALGPHAAAIIGKTWADALAALPQAHDGVITGHLARHETWSSARFFWPLAASGEEIAVDLAGEAIHGETGRFTGYRGFGLIRGGTLRPLRQGAPKSATPPAPTPLAPTPSPAAESAPRKAALPEPQASLSDADKLTLREIALTLGGRIQEPPQHLEASPEREEQRPADQPATPRPSPLPPERPAASIPTNPLDLLPVGILIHRGEKVLFANRALLDMMGYANVDRLAELGVVGLFRDSPALTGSAADHPFLLTDATGQKLAVEVKLSSIDWQDVPASLMLIRQAAETGIVEQLRRSERDAHERGERIRELESVLATATDGIVTLDEAGRILSLNGPAEALFGYEEHEVANEAITVLLAPESHMVALDYLDGLRMSGVSSLLEGGREVIGKVRQGGFIPIFMTIGRITAGGTRKLCAVLRDITAFKKAEGELLAAKKAAEDASAQKSDLLAKISHEIRTPLNAIIGFAEMMLEERMGPIGNERYKSYLKDMHASGTHVMSLVNDLLDLAKIEAGHVDLNFTRVQLNDLVASCVGMMHEQAARERIIMRTGFAANLPPVVADERSVRQIVLNLLSNAIKFTDAGGQVIVSTAVTETNAVVIRVRDTGIGMSEDDIVAALEPFRQLATTRQRGGTGLGLPLTKALIEANRGSFEISSARNEGTLVEVIFPPTRVLAE